MLQYPSFCITALLALASTVSATTYSPPRFATSSIPGQLTRIFLYSNTTIQILPSIGTAPTPASVDEWLVGKNLANTPTSITNVLPTSDIAAVGYISQGASLLTYRVFYQTTEGDIRSAFFNGSQWSLDPTVIAAGAAYETPITAFRDQDATREVIGVQYLDSNRLLTQRTATTDGGNWGPSVTITT